MHTLTRTGLLATKIGMSQVFDKAGRAIAVTLLHVKSNYVLGNKNKEKEGYDAVVIGYDTDVKATRVSKSVRGTCSKSKVKPVRFIKEFRISSQLEVGKQLSIQHFIVGQKVDISGITVGKGFAGSMKRHNFSGLEASHGVSLTHRAHGSTGQRQDPGKVFKGKKMAGHMGDVKVTIQSLEIIDIDQELSVIAIRGAVPGSKGKVVTITDAIKKGSPADVPFPAQYVEDEKVI